MSVQIKLRRDTAANWVSVNPILGAGEPGLETDTLKIKYGDGASHWNQLTYPTVYATPTPASALTGATLPSNIVNSSLQSVGVLTNLTVTNPIVGSITGNAATATLATNATSATNSTYAISANIAGTLSGGAANQIVYQTGSGNIAYVAAPALSATYLEWNGTSFSWSALPTISASALTGTSLATSVVTSSLTTVGTLNGLVSNYGTWVTGAFSPSYSGSYTSGLVSDYSSSTGRFSVGSGAGFAFYTGGVGTTPVLSVSSSGSITVPANLSYSGLEIVSPNYVSVTSTATYSLSATQSWNILQVNNTGYTATINMPTSPVDGQVCRFSVTGNTVTLAVGTGTVTPTFAGSTTAGTVFRYVYQNSTTTWYKC